MSASMFALTSRKFSARRAKDRNWIASLRPAGLSQQKATYILDLARKVETREVRLDTASHDDYLAKLRKAFVIADFEERKAAVLASARKLVNGLVVREELLEEVTNLVEWPTVVFGRLPMT